jgi:hypothetical protein
MQNASFWQSRLVELARDLDALEAEVIRLRERQGCLTIKGGTDTALAEIAVAIETADAHRDEIARVIEQTRHCTIAAVDIARQVPMAGMRHSIPLLMPIGF